MKDDLPVWFPESTLLTHPQGKTLPWTWTAEGFLFWHPDWAPATTSNNCLAYYKDALSTLQAQPKETDEDKTALATRAGVMGGEGVLSMRQHFLFLFWFKSFCTKHVVNSHNKNLCETIRCSQHCWCSLWLISPQMIHTYTDTWIKKQRELTDSMYKSTNLFLT